MSDKQGQPDVNKREIDHETYQAKEKELQTGDKKLDGPNRPST